MNYRLIIKASARDEIQQQADFYEKQREGLGLRFINVVKEAREILTQFPHAQIRYGQVRCVPVKGFPCMLHFVINEEKRIVKIFGVLHTARNPDSTWGADDWIVSEPVYYYGQIAV